MAGVDKPKRLIWIVNHRTLLPAEVPILRDLGYEVLIPKLVPSHDPAYRSSAVSWEYDESLTIPADVLEALNAHNFYQQIWMPDLTAMINEHFDVVVTAMSLYVIPLAEASYKFRGRLVARVFGREHPRTYTELLGRMQEDVLWALARKGSNFVFGQGYDSVAEVEAAELRQRAHTITVPLPASTYAHGGTWRGDGDRAVLLCPGIRTAIYYQGIYDAIKADFGDLPHAIFGRQDEPVDDPAVLPFLTDKELFDLYATTPVFLYPSDEPRHVHYSPIEAMVVGTPVLYRRDALIDRLAGETLAGSCADTAEMHDKAEALLGGDVQLAKDICATQQQIIDTFSADLAKAQWAAALS